MKNASEQNQNATPPSVRAALSKLEDGDLTPSLFLKTRVAAVFRERQKNRRSLLIWKTVTACAIAGCASLAVILLQRSSVGRSFVADNAYVIHLDFTNDDLKNVASVEVSLPEKVHFVADRNRDLNSKKILRLPIRITEVGRTRLPFVVSASEAGTQTLHVRLFNEKNEFLNERDLKVRFAKNQGSVAL